MRWTCDHLGIGPGSRATLLVSTTFDVHLIELWASLCSGAALCVAPDDARGSAAELFHWWQKLGLTHCVVLPTPLAELVFDRPWPAGLALRQLGVGGDRMRVRPPIDCTATVHNMYGPAEAAVITTSYQLERTPEAAGQPVPIGTPIKGVTVFVTDDNGRLLPRGTVGELRIGGAGLAIGYLDERLTADRFVPAPANQYGVQRVYRTGDRVLMRSDGLLEYFGRFDDQVKISGIRIEPGEVEAALEVHPSVNRAVVVTTSGVTGDLRLAAFVKLADNASEDAKGILRTARERLLEQAVPTILHFITDLPTTANGKVDRAILAERAAEKNANNVRDLESARSTTEAFLLATCQELLDAHDLSADDNLAASGGTSLAVARLIAVIEETYRIRLKAAQVMRQPDLRAVATLIDAQVQTHTS